MESKNSDKLAMLAKVAPYVLDFIIVAGTFGFGYLLFYVGIPSENKDIMNMMFGTLIGLSVTIVNYHRGSSEGSSAKQSMLDKMVGRKNDGD
jgi:hypothetical protein